MAKLILPWLFSNQFLEKENYVEAFISSIVYDPHPQSSIDQKRQLDALIKTDLRGELAQINCDTLIISSNEDLLTPPFINKEIITFIKNSKLVNIPGGHVSPIEQPDILSQTILNFL
ncbi:MAG: alpha/beta fold hydrolase [Neisseriaceae bacterium]